MLRMYVWTLFAHCENHKSSKPGEARPSQAIREEVYSSSRHKQNYIMMLKFPLYLEEASDKKYTAAAAKQRQKKAEEVQNLSKIPL